MPELPTTPRGAATSRRILDTAAAEFAERGIAGARIDRIIATAHTNKAQLYGYFGSKEGLLDAVIADFLERGANDVPFDADDLPGWAVALYDGALRNPGLIRLMGWIRLERRPAGLVFDGIDLEPKLAAVARAQAAGRLRPGDPADLLALVAGMASAWSPASGVYPASAAEPAADHERRRALLRDAVRCAISPLCQPTASSAASSRARPRRGESFHLHVHLVPWRGGDQLRRSWVPRPVTERELDEVLAGLR